MSILELNETLFSAIKSVDNPQQNSLSEVNKLVRCFSEFLSQILRDELAGLPPVEDIDTVLEMNDSAINCVEKFFSNKMKERVLTVQSQKAAKEYGKLNTLLSEYFSKTVLLLPHSEMRDVLLKQLDKIRPSQVVCLG